MLCSKCGREIPDESVFCPECGYAVYEDDVLELERDDRKVPYEEQEEAKQLNAMYERYGKGGAEEAEETEEDRAYYRKRRRRKKRSGIVLALLIALLAICLVGIVWYAGASIFRNASNRRGEEASSRQETPVPTAAPEVTETPAVTFIPTSTPQPSPTETPTPEPTPTQAPLETPTPMPTPTAAPTFTPTPEPTSTPEPTPEPTPVPTSTPVPVTPPPTIPAAGVIPNSSSQPITEDVLDGLSEWEIKVARNEIFARHGRLFNDPNLQAHFNAQSWYNGTIAPADFRDSMLSDLEKQNLQVIMAYEHAHGLNNQ